MNNALTKFISYYARESSKYAAFLLVIGTSLLFIPQAQANMGLQAYFYDNYTEDNLYNNAPPIPPDRPVVFSIPVATVDQDYDLYPMPGLVDDFVVKYEGYITATESATVNLQCLADDGCIVIIDGVTIIDEWWDKGTDGGVYEYTLVPNQSLSFTVWYYENGGGAVIQLRWQFPNGDWAIVPESVFSTVVKDIVIANPNPTPQDTETTQTVVETSTSIADTSTAETLTPVVPSDTQTNNTLPVETGTAPSESSTQTIPIETQTPVVEIPLPTPPPIVEPEPIPVPIPVVVEPQPIPPVEPEPAPEPEPIPEDPPLEEVEPEPAPPAPEELPPDEPPSERPVEEDTNEIPSEPEAEAPPEPAPAPEPPPVEEPEPTPVPDVAPEPPMVAAPDATEAEKEIVAQSIIAEANGQPVTAQAIVEAGLTYADLPPETPVEVRTDEEGNEVVITAEVAAALEVLANPAELLNAIFTDPAQAFLAIGSIGADMSTQERAESEKTIVAAVIVGQIAGQAAVTAAAGAAAYRRNP